MFKEISQTKWQEHTKRLCFDQVIYSEWLDHVVNLMIAGKSEQVIRANLEDFLAKQNKFARINNSLQFFGKIEKIETYHIIEKLASWFAPKECLIPFRDKAFELIQKENPKNWLPYHWAIMSVSHPICFFILKAISEFIKPSACTLPADRFEKKFFSSNQLIDFFKEQPYGNREVLNSNIRKVLETFVVWGFLEYDYGYYNGESMKQSYNIDLTMLLYEVILLLDTKNCQTSIVEIINNPVLKMFKVPILSNKYVSQYNSKNIEVLPFEFHNNLLVVI